MPKLSINYSFILLLILTSCGSYKTIPYFQDLAQKDSITQNVLNYSPLAIRANDILAINVISRNPESSSIFNYNLSNVKGNFTVAPDNPLIGYPVDENGNIHLPLIGTLQAAGLTTLQLRDKLNTLLLTYYKDPVVNIRIVNFNVSVLGDVLRPDVYTLQNEHTTITQAISMAGDLNITAKRTNVLIIRTENGKRKFVRLDLTSKNIFNSPYYYLKNNDEIYVQPDRTKYATVDRGYRTATLVLSGLSIIAIVLSNLYR
ncbi:polysaccharide biosynthesis/export family protein [Arcticibacter eurypsychrophilus]|uniref:polysaccharide biosynthesis/export family protein n=1 Tax=Arcticibacter eurypsychrophilus TaxID=1434752 RepID=UPI00084DB8DB|nr:polysaccharide biosynthesis/export family protein [Arcticibacter eurypsychrophilus]